MADKICYAVFAFTLLCTISATGVMLIGMAFPETFKAIDEMIAKTIRGGSCK